MSAFLNGVSSVSVLLILTATGYICARLGWMETRTKSFLSHFLMTLAIPATCIHGLVTRVTREMAASSLKLMCVPFFGIVIMFTLSFILAKKLGLPRKRFGVFMMMCGVSNSIIVGYPMCTELFGSEASTYVMLYYLPHMLLMNTIGVTAVRWSGSASLSLKSSLLNFLKTPPIWGIVIGLFFVITGFQPPSFILSSLGYLSNCVTPLAMILTGYIIYEVGLSNIRLDKSQAVVLLCRFVLHPSVCLILCLIFGVHGMARSVFAIECAMPVVTTCVVSSAAYGADDRYAALTSAATTIACFAVIPILVVLL